MTIDWFTVGAQTLNFLLLVWLLKRYLYGPILKAIDDRETQTAKVINQADAIKLDAQLQRKMLEKKNNEFDAKRDELFTKAKNTALSESAQIIAMAHINADQISKSRLQALERELEHYQQDIALKTLQEVYDVARKVLADLASVELEQNMFECFCKRLQNMTLDEKHNFNKALDAGNTELLIYSAFELTQTQIDKVDGILQQVSSAKSNSHFHLKLEVKTTLISGIEIRSNGWKIAWSTEDYLNVLQTFISQLLIKQRESIHNRTAQLNTQRHNVKNSA
jgi:F-type H+-transporting ATPase subunit b